MVAAALTLALPLTLLLPAHTVPDGVVYRGVQVVVRPDRVEIRYQLGLNEKMVRAELNDRFGIDKPADSNSADDLLEFRDRMAAELPKWITAEIDDHPMPLELHRADVIRQQHAQLEFVYHLTIVAGPKPQRLEIEDGNYPEVPGYHLMAIKSRGQVDVLQQGQDGEVLLARMQRALAEDGAADAEVEPIRRLEAYFATPSDYTMSASSAEQPVASDTADETNPNPTPGRQHGNDQPEPGAEDAAKAPASESVAASTGEPDSLPRPRGYPLVLLLAILALLALAVAKLSKRFGWLSR